MAKAYVSHEQTVLTGVIGSTCKSNANNHINADILNNPQIMQHYLNSQTNLSSAFLCLMAVVENHLDLKANQNFLTLQSQLEKTENRISVARRDYIEAVRVYNTALKTMPTMIWAKLWFHDAKPMQIFIIDTQQKPKVNFN
ncbi:LemA family protein [Bartonella melophagi]